jgi:hypothetical protein
MGRIPRLQGAKDVMEFVEQNMVHAPTAAAVALD